MCTMQSNILSKRGAKNIQLLINKVRYFIAEKGLVGGDHLKVHEPKYDKKALPVVGGASNTLNLLK